MENSKDVIFLVFLAFILGMLWLFGQTIERYNDFYRERENLRFQHIAAMNSAFTAQGEKQYQVDSERNQLLSQLILQNKTWQEDIAELMEEAKFIRRQQDRTEARLDALTNLYGLPKPRGVLAPTRSTP